VKIVLLAHNLRSGGGIIGGKNFVSALARAAPQHRYIITAPADYGYERIVLPKNSGLYACSKVASPISRFLLEIKKIPSLVKSFKADAVLGLGNFGLIDIGCPQAIWIRNGYLVYPPNYIASTSLRRKGRIFVEQFVFKKCLRTTQLLFCQTPVMRQRVTDYYGYDIKKTRLLPNAFSQMLRDDMFESRVKRPSVISENDFNCLILSKFYPHKNPQIVLDAFQDTKKLLRGLRFITTLSPQDSPATRAFLKTIENDNVFKKHIFNVGYICHEQLGMYYRNIQLLLMPTLLESFSVTYLEAMNFGVPILTTDCDFAHYICGDAAVYYNPKDRSDFINKLMTLKSDTVLRSKVIRSGKKQLELFNHTWDEIVHTAIGELEKIVESKS
jgi:glycosyltransferase involved in cell wall biosynthesis